MITQDLQVKWGYNIIIKIITMENMVYIYMIPEMFQCEIITDITLSELTLLLKKQFPTANA